MVRRGVAAEAAAPAGRAIPASSNGRRAPGGDARVDELIRTVLRTAREHLGLDIGFVSQLIDGQRVFRYVDAGGASCPISVGDADPAEESFCHHVVTGDLPRYLPDPSAHPISAAIAATSELPVGTHLSVPIELSDGGTYGTFCCFAHGIDDGVDERDLGLLRVLADSIAGYLEEEEAARRARERRREELRGSVRDGGLEMAYQPICDLTTRRTIGLEALARFPGLGEGPAEVFADAGRLGIGPELELAAVRAAVAELPRIPPGIHLTVNASPETVASGAFYDVVRSIDAQRLVVEITEHDAVADYDVLRSALDDLRDLGVRLAIDDVGAGFSGLLHILRLEPDVLKVDGALVERIDAFAAKQAMLAALVTFGSRRGTEIVAERIGTQEELEAVRVLGVRCGQGYHLRRPVDLAEALSPIPGEVPPGSARTTTSMPTHAGVGPGRAGVGRD